MAKVIIEAAINGVALRKSLNPHVAYDSDGGPKAPTVARTELVEWVPAPLRWFA